VSLVSYWCRCVLFGVGSHCFFNISRMVLIGYVDRYIKNTIILIYPLKKETIILKSHLL
jgi:hypothetical protein